VRETQSAFLFSPIHINLISVSISHELRTPLHGILAAAELLSDTVLDQHQASILQTVQACGTSLVETVNHVLDFTKLSGNTKSGGVETVIEPTRVDLMQLVEEAVEGCWIGYRARASALGESDIGSVYSPPMLSPRESAARSGHHVETVVDIDLRTEVRRLPCVRRLHLQILTRSLYTGLGGQVREGWHSTGIDELDRQ
jgi:signal transduction histidine kinase